MKKIMASITNSIGFMAGLVLVLTMAPPATATTCDQPPRGRSQRSPLGDFRPDLSVHGRAVGSFADGYSDNLGGARAYLWDFLDTNFSNYAMMVFEMDRPYDSMRLYPHQDRYSGGPVTTDFVAQDVMEYSI